MAINFENIGPKLTAAQVRGLERKIGVPLPEDYSQFLRETNGGRPPEIAIHLAVAEADVLVDFLFGLVRKPGIIEWLAELRRDMPTGFIPIGKDPGGNIFLMELNPPNQGTIYYWDKAQWFTTSSPEGNTYHVAQSFSRFLELIS